MTYVYRIKLKILLFIGDLIVQIYMVIKFDYHQTLLESIIYILI